MIGLDFFTDVKKLFFKTNLRLSVEIKIQQFENCRLNLCRNFSKPPGTAQNIIETLFIQMLKWLDVNR